MRNEIRHRRLTAATAWLLAALALGTYAGAAVAAEVVALGASNTRGKGVSLSEAYPAHLEHMLRARGFDVSVHNAGINGNTTGQMLARLDAALSKKTRIVILQPGGNDRRRGISRDERRANVRAIKRHLRALGIGYVKLGNGLIRSVARDYPRPDGQHFLSEGYEALAERLLPKILEQLRRR